MIRRAGTVVAIVATLAVLLAPAGASAQSTSSAGPAASANASAIAEVEANPGAVIREIVERWRGQFHPPNPSQNVAGGEAEITGVLERASAEKLLAASQAESYQEALAALSGRQDPSLIVLEPGQAIPATLGSTSGDLVFTPITPCRIFDTRFASGDFAGKVGPNTGNWFSVNLANFSAQGGAASCPGMPTTFNPSAVAINVTSTAQTGVGSLRLVECGGGLPLVSLLNYTPGVNLANAAVIRSALSCALGPGGNNDLFVYSQNAASDVVVDLMGYFAAPERTAPDQFVLSTGAVDIGTGTQSIFTDTCPAGYRLSGVGGGVNDWTADVEFISVRPAANGSVGLVSGANAATQALCQFRNDTAGPQSVYCLGICLRIPGR